MSLASDSRRADRAVRIVVPAALTVLGLVAFDSIVRARFTDAPWLIALWCLCTFGLLTVAPWRAKRSTPEAPVASETLVVAALLLVLLAAFHVSFLRAASDGRELFVQVRSLVMDRDLDFSNDSEAFGARGTAGVYPPGTAILWAPFHAACHLWLGMLNLAGGEYDRTGYTNPYQRAIGLATLLYGAVALVLIYRHVRQYFNASTSLLAWSAVLFGSFVAWYLAVESSMAHGVSLFAVTLFVAVWHGARGRRTARSQLLLGITAGLMILVRWENAAFLVVPALEGLVDLVGIARRRSRRGVGDLARSILWLGAGTLLALLPLVPFWSALPERGLVGVTEYHEVASRGFHLVGVLFSPDHGLFSWTPVIYLAVLGLPLFVCRDPLLGWGLMLALVALVAASASIPGWDGGSGFGARRFTAAALPFTLGLAALIAGVRRRPLGAVGAVLGVLVAANVFVMADLRAGKMNPGLGLTWDRVFEAAYSRVGNPFSFPGSLIFSLRYDAPLRLYDRLGAHRYNDLLIDMGAAGDDEFLLDGWSDRERDGERTFRWAVTKRARLIVPMRGGNQVFRLRLAPFVFPGATVQYVDVLVNGQKVGSIEALPGMRDYDVPFSRETFFDPVAVELRFAWARSPWEVGLSNDRRPLSVQVDNLRFTRIGRARP